MESLYEIERQSSNHNWWSKWNWRIYCSSFIEEGAKVVIADFSERGKNYQMN